ncbi:MAG TPA: NUDIX hydrolase [Anaerohalosphaeraceae bacterium]|jgi:ADP-ribose pyrophosphatase YjhB (NUDIX family)|nr:NUDIX hydrolase [Anaerohalosphaeraceae bacterium]HRT49922.1 NUDIX hydrolase [Anaerohalosphaeraceae bacterium]HRT85780.1 NUDIX hydrolase [Anaerohalosphaeraceae bacterium]
MCGQWLTWAQRLAAIAQSGLTYSQNEYEIERYQAVLKIAADMMEAGGGGNAQGLVEMFGREKGYATPKVDVRGAAFRDGRILLVKEAIDGLWTLPGGWADVGDSPSEAIRREMVEESGFEVEVVKLCAVYDRSKHPHRPAFPFHLYKMFFLCEITGGEAKTSHETLEVGFFAEDALPPLSEGRVLPFQIKTMFDHYRDRSLPTYCD